MAEDGSDLGILTTVAAIASVVRILKDILVRPKSGESTMVAIPSDMEIYVLIAAVGFAILFGIGTYLWRYAEHNARHDLDRQSNKLFGKGAFKFIGAEIFAVVLTAVLAFYGAAVAPFKLGIAEPVLLDYILAAGVVALIAGILLTILFNEGISGLGKFIKQKADETVEAVNNLSGAVLEAKATAEKLAKEMGLNKKKTKAYVDKKVEEAKLAEAEAKAAEPTGDIVVPLEGEQ